MFSVGFEGPYIFSGGVCMSTDMNDGSVFKMTVLNIQNVIFHPPGKDVVRYHT